MDSFELQVKPVAFYSGLSSSTEIKYGNKVILPTRVLTEITNEYKENVVYPLVFKVTTENGNSFAVGVKDFSTETDSIYLPKRLMETNWVPYDSQIQLTYITPPKGTLVKLQPHKTAFTLLESPKELLEKNIIANYPVLTCGETLSICHKEETYYIDVLGCEPENIISTFNTDLSVDFAPPLDYEEYEQKYAEQKKTTDTIEPHVNSGSNSFTQFLNHLPNPLEEDPTKFVAFSGKGRKLGN